MRVVKSVFVGACGLLLLTGCFGGTKASTVSTSAPVTASGSDSPAMTNSGSPVVSVAAIRSYVQAVASGAPAEMRERLALTEPNSGAYFYLDLMANVAQASLDAGQPAQKKSDVTPVGTDAFTECSESADQTTCATFGDFMVNQGGKLVDLAVQGQPVGARLRVGSGQSVTAGGARLTFLIAYASVMSDVLIVTVNVQAGAGPITINPSSWSYRGPDGQPGTMMGTTGVAHVLAKSSLIVAVSFPSAVAGGKLTLGGCLTQQCPGGSFSAVMNVS